MSTKSVTIIIPAYNEEKNIEPLVERIDLSCKEKDLLYSIIFVDDRSTDGTPEQILLLAKKYPITLITKEEGSSRGKAGSLLLGFAQAKTDVIAMIDADLQYPPEAIPAMVAKLDEGVDVVVANRTKREAGIIRDIFSFAFRTIFGKLLYGFSEDVQSGLKVFRKQIIERIKISPSQWMFDLEFLLRSRDAGYKIASYNIEFSSRHAGKAKIGVLSAAVEMATAAIRLKFNKSPIIPFHPNDPRKVHGGFHYRGNSFISFSHLPHEETAFARMTQKQSIFLFGAVLIILGLFILNWHASLLVFVALLSILYFADLLFNFFLVSRSFTKIREITVAEEEYKTGKWPKYTVFCPLYKEWKVLPQFIRAMSQLDYPKDKLQVMLLLEEDDVDSIEHISAMQLPTFFTVKIVPESKPKTKPKALNYGLQYAKGEYAVIYDAEDIPEPEQLKKAVVAFGKADPKTVCIQAKLNFYNPHQNLLTRIFTAEYSLWFDLVLPGLQSIDAPIPLGGTSNHFRVQDLHDLHGWDAFNVTEDCDLGMRLTKRGLRTAIVDSTTMEEANSRYFNWYGQRSRWIKGYIQTYLVHIRNLKEFSRDIKHPDVFTFQLVIGGKVLSMFINPFLWIVTISYFAFRAVVGPAIESFYPMPVLYLAVFSLIFGNFLYMYYYMVGCVKRNYFDLIKYALITPVYWLAMSLAAWRALFEVMSNPHYWNKTVHGFHLDAKKHRSLLRRKNKVVTTNQDTILTQTQKTHISSNLPAYCGILQPQQQEK
jgi:glycosyltransferase XagB